MAPSNPKGGTGARAAPVPLRLNINGGELLVDRQVSYSTRKRERQRLERAAQAINEHVGFDVLTVAKADS